MERVIVLVTAKAERQGERDGGIQDRKKHKR